MAAEIPLSPAPTTTTSRLASFGGYNHIKIMPHQCPLGTHRKYHSAGGEDEPSLLGEHGIVPSVLLFVTLQRGSGSACLTWGKDISVSTFKAVFDSEPGNSAVSCLCGGALGSGEVGTGDRDIHKTQAQCDDTTPSILDIWNDFTPDDCTNAIEYFYLQRIYCCL